MKTLYVLTTGTGSGKSLSYIVPIVDYILKNGSGNGIKAIIVYPMNALANSQELELDKFLQSGRYPVTFRRYTGQEKDAARQEIINNPPDILLTNYVMLELVLTRPYERKLVQAAANLQFLVFDELHTYRGRQGADVAMLVRRLRETLGGAASQFRCVGTSATLAGPGTFEQKREDVAAVASKLFGDEILPGNVIVETLASETARVDLDAPGARQALAASLAASLPDSYVEFIAHPLVAWLENTIGVEMRAGRLERCRPRSLEGKNGLAKSLAACTGLPESECGAKIRAALLAGSRIKKPDSDKPVFAFKLHQFISKGDTVYCTLESEHARHITLFGQKLAPGRDSATPLYPLNFCRECGKEYYSVALVEDESGNAFFRPLNAGRMEEDVISGYLFISAADPWPEASPDQLERLPGDWLEEKDGQLALSRSKRKYLPRAWHVRPDGAAFSKPVPGSIPAWFMEASFAFCPQCLVSYAPRLNDFSKLATLGTEGRSTATTVLSMSTVNHLREESDLDPIAAKFLCFSDNRQDASLQSGHFNDFAETGLIRSALYNAVARAGAAGLEYDKLPEQVFDCLGLGYADGQFPREKYSAVPDAKFIRATQVDKAFRAVLEYRIYSDLRRGWRIVAPNLEQCGLLEIEYLALHDLCQDDSCWGANPQLAAADAQTRKRVALAFLDYLRSKLIIKADALDHMKQEEIARQSRQ